MYEKEDLMIIRWIHNVIVIRNIDAITSLLDLSTPSVDLEHQSPLANPCRRRPIWIRILFWEYPPVDAPMNHSIPHRHRHLTHHHVRLVAVGRRRLQTEAVLRAGEVLVVRRVGNIVLHHGGEEGLLPHPTGDLGGQMR